MRTSSVFQPTLPLRGATRLAIAPRTPFSVSTHAPLAGSDARTRPRWTATASFNPRSPCGERHAHHVSRPTVPLLFQPTLPLRGATSTARASSPTWPSFNPTLPLRGATEAGRIDGLDIRVSTHAPLAGSDANVRLSTLSSSGFQPTLPLRGATKSSAANSMAIVFQPTLPLRGATLPP